jgi:hypothetical protein
MKTWLTIWITLLIALIAAVSLYWTRFQTVEIKSYAFYKIDRLTGEIELIRFKQSDKVMTVEETARYRAAQKTLADTPPDISHGLESSEEKY